MDEEIKTEEVLGPGTLIFPKKDEQFTEHQPHDPLGVILEKNVTETRDLTKPQIADSQEKPENDIQEKITKFYLQQPLVQRVFAVLKNRGMDSQQAEQALKEIRDIIEG